MASELEQAYSHCQRITKSEAGNFYYACRTLPANRRRAIYAAYAFCRICDDIADDGATLEDKKVRFAETRRQLRASSNGHAAGPVFLALSDAASTFSIPFHYFEKVIEGVEMDLIHTRYRDFDELRGYCYKVASVVGLISIEVFGYQDPRAKSFAVDLGIAMQLTNILRDIREDADRGRIYLPLDEVASFGYSEKELEAGVVNDAFRGLMRFQVARARSYFVRGRRLIPLLSPRARTCPMGLAGVYGRILSHIEGSNYDVYRRRIGLTTTDKLLLIARLWASNLLPLSRLQRR